MIDSINDCLIKFKQMERPEVILTIVDDMVAARILVAWTHISVRIRKPSTRCRRSDLESQWRWIWRHTNYSLKELSIRSGQSLPEIRRRMAMLIGNYILYPDGSLNQYVHRYLRKVVADVFDLKSLCNKRRATTAGSVTK